MTPGDGTTMCSHFNDLVSTSQGIDESKNPAEWFATGYGMGALSFAAPSSRAVSVGDVARAVRSGCTSNPNQTMKQAALAAF